MEVNKILSADILDIIFEGRNKEYGAYELRKTYNKRLLLALGGTILISLIVIGYVVSGMIAKNSKTEMVILNDVILDPFKETEKDEPLPPPPPPKPEPRKVEMTRFVIPIIVKEEVREDEKPPEVEKLEGARIGTINQQGDNDKEIVDPPFNDAKRGLLEAPKRPNDDPDGFVPIQLESQYPGGPGAWMHYLNKTFRYPEQAQRDEIEGTVVVQFIVDREGNVSDIEAVSGPTGGGLREEAIRVIKKSGKWEPAIQNGRKVKSYKKQPITFKLEAQ